MWGQLTYKDEINSPQSKRKLNQHLHLDNKLFSFQIKQFSTQKPSQLIRFFPKYTWIILTTTAKFSKNLQNVRVDSNNVLLTR